jgi:hypothetical protein
MFAAALFVWEREKGEGEREKGKGGRGKIGKKQIKNFFIFP